MRENHGLTKHRLYKTWQNMKNRCKNLKNKDYGGRGIKVCNEWNKSFIEFYNWSMKNGYSENLVIDRKNNDGNYEPSNCRFITQSENKTFGRTRKKISNTSGFIGVDFDKKANKFRAQIKINGKKIHIGYYSTPTEARQARIDYEIKTFSEQKTFD